MANREVNSQFTLGLVYLFSRRRTSWTNPTDSSGVKFVEMLFPRIKVFVEILIYGTLYEWTRVGL